MRHALRLHLGRWAVAHFTAFPAAVGAASGLEEGDKSSKRGYYAFIEILPKPPARECEQFAISPSFDFGSLHSENISVAVPPCQQQ